MMSHPADTTSVRSVAFFAQALSVCACLWLSLLDCHYAAAQQIVASPDQDKHIELSLPENSAAGTLAGTVSEHFPTLTNFRLARRSRSTAFAVAGDSGAIVVREGADLNFERRLALSLTIEADRAPEARDPFLDAFAASLLNEGLTSRKLEKILPSQQLIHVRIEIQDVAEPPHVVSQSITVSETTEIGGLIGQVSADDPDRNESFHFEIVSGNQDGHFTIDELCGELQLAQPLNASVCSEYRLSVRVTDKDGQTADGEVSIQVTPSPEKLPESETASASTTTSAGDGDSSEDGRDEKQPVASAKPLDLAPMPVPASAEDPSPTAESTVATPANTDIADPAMPSVSASESVPSAVQKAAIQNSTSATGSPVDNKSPEPAASHAVSVPDSAAVRTPDVVLSKPKFDAVPEPLPHRMVQASSETRSVLALLAALSVIGGLIYSYRRAMIQRKEALLLKEKEDAEFKARLAELTALEQAAEEQEPTEALAPPAAPRIDATEKDIPEERASFDPEDLISEEYFLESTGHSDSSPEVQSTACDSSAAVVEVPGVVHNLQRQLEQRDDVIADLKSKIEALGDRLEFLANHAADDRPVNRDHRQSDPSDDDSDRRPRRPRASADESEMSWNQNPTRFDSSDRSRPATRFERDPERSSDEYIEPDSISSSDSAVTETVAAECAISTDAASLRSELAGLFAMHSKPAVSVDPVAPVVTEDDACQSTEESKEKAREESHLDSVAKYLSELLDRSKKEEAGENEIFADRRKPTGKAGGKWDGIDRRGGAQKPKPQVKSYIETYLSEHGGKLEPVHEPVPEVATESLSDESRSPKPNVARAPVDVNAIRQHMDSFRQVATVSVEHALASYQIRQARGKLAWRSLLAIGLVVIATLAILTNVARTIHFASLNWMMGAIILLSLTELSLRVQSIRRHRKELQLRIQEPQRSSGPPEKPTEAVEASNSKQP